MTRTIAAPGARLALALCILAATLLAQPAARAAEDAPDLALRLWTTPTRASRGDVVAYEILIDNVGSIRADRVRVTLPFSPHMRVLRTEFDHRATWVSDLSADKLTVMFGRMPGKSDRRAKIFFEIGPDAPDGLEVHVRAVARYEGDRDEKVRSNYTTLTIGGQEVDARPAATVEPASAPAGTRLTVRVRNYFPDERISTWLNAPDGVRETRLATSADSSGDATMELSTSRLAPGAYTLVVYGE
jgi:hypothetical protein